MKIHAELTTIRADASYATQHGIDHEQYAKLCEHYESVDDEWPYPPVLVVEDDGNGARVLDGHHRRALAADYGVREIPAWEISAEDFGRLIVKDFGGDVPDRLQDLDPHILCNGKAYTR